MSNYLETILVRLKDRLDRPDERVRPPLLYLDPEVTRHLFQEMTGLGRPPDAKVTVEPQSGRRRVDISWEEGQSSPLPDPILYEAMETVLEKKVPLVERAEDLSGLVHNYARIKGPLQATHFPDGNLNLEIVFAGVRGLLFYTEEFFSSLVRPLLSDDRFHTFYCEVEALVYLQGQVKKMIFYHHSYGDNQEHDWVPLVPVAVRSLSSGQSR